MAQTATFRTTAGTKTWEISPNKVVDIDGLNTGFELEAVEDMMFLKYDTERIYLFTEGLPVNGWYKVFYIKNDNDFLINDNRVYGYIHKSQLSWGY